MLGRTNAVSKSGGGSGDIVQAVNRTGELIHSGDKVWIIPQTQQVGDGFQIERDSLQNTRFITDNDCNYIRYGRYFDYLDNNIAEHLSSGYAYFYTENWIYNYGNSSGGTAQNGRINILYNGEVIVPDYDVGTTISGIIPSDNTILVYFYNYETKNIISYNKETKEYTEYVNSDALTISGNNLFIKGNKIYNAYSSSSSRWYAEFNEETKTFNKVGDLVITGYNTRLSPLGITNDGKIIGCRSSGDTSGVLVAELRTDNELYIFGSEEVEGLEECYYEISKIHPMFFPDSQILTYVKWDPNTSVNSFTYGVFRYLGENKWQKLNVILPLDPPENLDYVPTQYCQYLAISTDLTKCMVGYWYSSSHYMLYRYQLESYDGNNLYKYRREIITENCLTGFANTDIQSGQSGEISTTLKAHISYTEPEPSTEQYEINQDTQGGIVFVGDLQTVAGPYGNTVAQITDTTRLTLGNDGANIFAGMFADTQTADCFRIKFKMPRKGISSGGTWFALSDSLSQNVENPTDGCVRFGFTASWDEQNSEIDSQVVSFIMDRYSSEQGWETLTKVVMPDFKLNTWYDVMYYYGKYADWEIEANGNSGYRLLINVYNEGGELIGREIYDNYPNGSIVSTENVQIGYPIYATSYFYIDVDLSQTGFQLLDSWVWRPVKEINQ